MKIDEQLIKFCVGYFNSRSFQIMNVSLINIDGMFDEEGNHWGERAAWLHDGVECQSVFVSEHYRNTGKMRQYISTTTVPFLTLSECGIVSYFEQHNVPHIVGVVNPDIPKFTHGELRLVDVTFPEGFIPRYVTKSVAEGYDGIWHVHQHLPVYLDGVWVSDGATYELGVDDTPDLIHTPAIGRGTETQYCRYVLEV